MKASKLAYLVVALLASAVMVLAHEQTATSACLSVEQVNVLLTHRNGATWHFAFEDKFALEGSECVLQEGAKILRYRISSGEQMLTYVGTAQYGHWYRIQRAGTGTIQYEDRAQAKLPPAPVIWVDIYLKRGAILRVIKFTPAIRRISVPWAIEYRLTLLEWDESARAWAGKTLDYRPRPTRGASGEIYDPHAYASSAMTTAQAQVFSNRYTPVVLDFIEDGIFSQDRLARWLRL